METKFLQISAAFVLILAFHVDLLAAECQCGVFAVPLGSDEAIGDVYVSEILPQACERLELDSQCHDDCYTKMISASANGDLAAYSEELGSYVGQAFCRHLRRNTVNAQLFSFYRWCGMGWKRIHPTSTTPLCCHNAHYVDCDDMARALSSTATTRAH